MSILLGVAKGAVMMELPNEKQTQRNTYWKVWWKNIIINSTLCKHRRVFESVSFKYCYNNKIIFHHQSRYTWESSCRKLSHTSPRFTTQHLFHGEKFSHWYLKTLRGVQAPPNDIVCPASTWTKAGASLRCKSLNCIHNDVESINLMGNFKGCMVGLNLYSKVFSRSKKFQLIVLVSLWTLE